MRTASKVKMLKCSASRTVWVTRSTYSPCPWQWAFQGGHGSWDRPQYNSIHHTSETDFKSFDVLDVPVTWCELPLLVFEHIAKVVLVRFQELGNWYGLDLSFASSPDQSGALLTSLRCDWLTKVASSSLLPCATTTGTPCASEMTQCMEMPIGS